VIVSRRDKCPACVWWEKEFQDHSYKKNGTIEMADEKTWLRQEVQPAQHP
jgi:hypothetical protein